MSGLDTNNNTVRATSDNSVYQVEKKFNWNKFITIFSLALTVATVATIALNSTGIIPDKFDIGPINSIPIADIAHYTLISEGIVAGLMLLVEGFKERQRNKKTDELPQEQTEPTQQEENPPPIATIIVGQKSEPKPTGPSKDKLPTIEEDDDDKPTTTVAFLPDGTPYYTTGLSKRQKKMLGMTT